MGTSFHSLSVPHGYGMWRWRSTRLRTENDKIFHMSPWTWKQSDWWRSFLKTIKGMFRIVRSLLNYLTDLELWRVVHVDHEHHQDPIKCIAAWIPALQVTRFCPICTVLDLEDLPDLCWSLVILSGHCRPDAVHFSLVHLLPLALLRCIAHL